MQPRFALTVLSALTLLVPPTLSPAQGQGRDDYPVAEGWFFSQANGRGGGGELGFRVTNEDGIRFWDWFQRYGGVPNVGYPISHRFRWNGFTVQAFQKVIFQWRPENQSVALVNVFDELSAANRDDWLLAFRQVPRSRDWVSDRGKAWPEIVTSHLALLDPYPALRAAYLAADDPIALNGLPMGVHELENVIVVRAQRKVFQQWKVDVPWARVGQVVVANGGDVAKEAGILPEGALVPQPPTSRGFSPPPDPAPLATAAPLPAGPPTSRSPIAGLWHKPIEDDIFLRRAAESGASWVRVFLTWEEVEPELADPPRYNWAATDRALRLLRERGLQPLVNIVDPPIWAAFPTCGPFRSPAMQERWLRFVRAAVERYRLSPYNVQYWVLYNEPDFRIQNPADKFGGGWGGGCWGNHPAEYGAMLRATTPVIKAVDPNARVVFGPLAADGCGPAFNCDFLRQVLDPALGNAAGAFDLLAFNYFPFYRRNWEQYGFSLLGKAEGLRQQLAAAGMKVPLIVAETGIVLDGTPKTDRDQANYVAQALTLALADQARPDGSGIQIAIWFTLRDSPDPNDRWGLTTSDGAIKLSYRAYQTWVKELAGARWLRSLSEPSYGGSAGRGCEGGDAYRCDVLRHEVFSVGETEKWVLWVDGGPRPRGELFGTSAQRQLRLPADRLLAVRDLEGNPVDYQREGSEIVLTVTESPRYVTLRR
ncbi:MAG: hypothetical protein KatS3mg061_0517 [Dehalococcoidia bacterium]|nr:MAG: hypothetical protein KatS3mg061_0517 [Dehalococcoidia bacterium]